MRNIFLLLVVIIIPGFAGCSKTQVPVEELRQYPVDSLEGLITRLGVEIDKEDSFDGNGSLRVTTAERAVVRLFETGDINAENGRLIYQARVRTENLDGKAYLEMWCHFPGKGEYFSRGLQTPLSGTNYWTVEETVFFLKKGENPDNVKLNLVVEGKGTVWIDDIRILKAPPGADGPGLLQ